MVKVTLPLKGGCQCGQLRYTITQAPYTLYCCHCRECQAQSSSAFGMSLRVPYEGFTLSGHHKAYIRDQGKATQMEGVFCPQCGTRVVHRGRPGAAGVSVKAGSLDDQTWLKPVGHIWASRAYPWLKLDGHVYKGQPSDTYQALMEAFASTYRFS